LELLNHYCLAIEKKSSKVWALAGPSDWGMALSHERNYLALRQGMIAESNRDLEETLVHQ